MTRGSSSPISMSPARGPARVLIVDDHPMMREGLKALVSSQPDLMACGEASNIGEALKTVHETDPDVAVVDIALDGENGLDLVRKFKLISASLRILVLSMYDDELYAERALEAGAMGYLNKQVVSRHIVAAIRQLLKGQRYLSAETEARLSLPCTGGTPTGAGHGVASLTNRELEVFQMIGSGLSTAEISARLFISVKTVESHRQKIKLKLGLQTAAQLSHVATQFFLQNG